MHQKLILVERKRILVTSDRVTIGVRVRVRVRDRVRVSIRVADDGVWV